MAVTKRPFSLVSLQRHRRLCTEDIVFLFNERSFPYVFPVVVVKSRSRPVERTSALSGFVVSVRCPFPSTSRGTLWRTRFRRKYKLPRQNGQLLRNIYDVLWGQTTTVIIDAFHRFSSSIPTLPIIHIITRLRSIYFATPVSLYRPVSGVASFPCTKTRYGRSSYDN